MHLAACLSLLVLATGPSLADEQRTTTADASTTLPAFVERGLRGLGHQAMDVLAGEWDVDIELYIAGGTPEAPLADALRAHRELIGGGRFLYDLTTGELSNGAQYWRAGTLGYSTIDQAYEWVTQDGVNANMMIYLAEPGSGPGFPADVVGTFTDQGVLGEAYVGETVGQRTVIEIQDDDHHRIDLYFTPPGEAERLVGRMVYTRARH